MFSIRCNINLVIIIIWILTLNSRMRKPHFHVLLGVFRCYITIYHCWMCCGIRTMRRDQLIKSISWQPTTCVVFFWVILALKKQNQIFFLCIANWNASTIIHNILLKTFCIFMFIWCSIKSSLTKKLWDSYTAVLNAADCG